jgi:DNA-binding MarR family transcriptional regulator
VTDATADADDLRRLAVALHDLSRTVRQAQSTQPGPPRLPPTEFELMRYVAAHPGTSVGAAAEGLDLRQSNVSAAVRGLVARGLVERAPDAADRRVTRLRPTELAEQHKDPVESGWARTLGAALAHLDPEDAAAVRAAASPLSRLAEARAPPPPGATAGATGAPAERGSRQQRSHELDSLTARCVARLAQHLRHPCRAMSTYRLVEILHLADRDDSQPMLAEGCQQIDAC